jgi:antitoxin CptB
MDLIMGRFADACIDAFGSEELDAFEKLIEAADADLYAWVTGERVAPKPYDTPILRRLREFSRRFVAG